LQQCVPNRQNQRSKRRNPSASWLTKLAEIPKSSKSFFLPCPSKTSLRFVFNCQHSPSQILVLLGFKNVAKGSSTLLLGCFKLQTGARKKQRAETNRQRKCSELFEKRSNSRNERFITFSSG